MIIALVNLAVFATWTLAILTSLVLMSEEGRGAAIKAYRHVPWVGAVFVVAAGAFAAGGRPFTAAAWIFLYIVRLYLKGESEKLAKRQAGNGKDRQHG